MMTYLVVIISQFLFIFFKQLNIRMVAERRIIITVILTTLIQSLWLISSYIGLKAMLDSNYTLALVYVLAGSAGNAMSFKVYKKTPKE